MVDIIDFPMNRRGVLYLIVGPSGVGKSTIQQRLLEFRFNTIAVSYTTRPIRDNEVNGKDYHFTDINEFEQMVARNEFVEHATVLGNMYGTTYSEIINKLDNGLNVIHVVDWQGALTFKKSLHRKYKTTVLYIIPTDLVSLKSRLQERGDAEDLVQQRFDTAKSELSHMREVADYVIENDDIQQCVNTINTITSSNDYKLNNINSNLSGRALDMINGLNKQ